MSVLRKATRAWIPLAAVLFLSALPLPAQDVQDLKKELDQLREQNRLLQEQLQQQRQMIDQLNAKFSGLQQSNQQTQTELHSLQSASENPPALEKPAKFSLGGVTISGEGAVGVIEGQRATRYDQGSLLLDEARLFFDAPVWGDVYFYSEVDLQTRDNYEADFTLGETYLEWDNLGKLWKNDQTLNARLGQFYIPFGEEYQYRFAMDDVLITHSLSDLWGVNGGLELFGAFAPLSYVVAVQNGGISTVDTGTADKSVAGRIGYDPLPWLHLSASGMRTGHLSPTDDGISAQWFGGNFFRPIGGAATTVFQANLAEADAQAKWKSGYVRLAGGYADYDDNNSSADDHRDIYYYYVEVLQGLAPKFYGAARWSQIRAPAGYPLAGDIEARPPPSTTDLWRLSLGLGYRFSPHLTLKVEYAFEEGQWTAGGSRGGENLFAAEVAFRF